MTAFLLGLLLFAVELPPESTRAPRPSVRDLQLHHNFRRRFRR